MFLGKGRVIPRDLAGPRARILVRHLQEFLFGIGILILFVKVGVFAGLGRFTRGANPGLKNFHRVVESRTGFRGLAPRISAPTEDRQGHNKGRNDDEPQRLVVRSHRLDAVNELLTNLVFLQILAQNMLRHRFTPWFVPESAIVSQPRATWSASIRFTENGDQEKSPSLQKNRRRGTRQ